MSVEFDQDQMSNSFKSRQVIGDPQVSGMARWLVRHGIIKDESNSKFVLVGILIFNLAAAVIIFIKFYK